MHAGQATCSNSHFTNPTVPLNSLVSLPGSLEVSSTVDSSMPVSSLDVSISVAESFCCLLTVIIPTSVEQAIKKKYAK